MSLLNFHKWYLNGSDWSVLARKKSWTVLTEGSFSNLLPSLMGLNCGDSELWQEPAQRFTNQLEQERWVLKHLTQIIQSKELGRDRHLVESGIQRKDRSRNALKNFYDYHESFHFCLMRSIKRNSSNVDSLLLYCSWYHRWFQTTRSL